MKRERTGGSTKLSGGCSSQAAELEFAEVTSEKRGDLDELLKKHIEELNQEIDQAAEEAARELEKQTLEQEAEMQETEAQEAGRQEAETQDVETRETIEAPVPSAPAHNPRPGPKHLNQKRSP